MQSLTVRMEEPDQAALDIGRESMLSELKRRRVKRSAAPALPHAVYEAGVLHVGPYTIRMMKIYDVALGRLVVSLDTVYGRGCKWQ